MNTEKTTSKQNFHNEKHGFVEFFAAIFAERMFSQVIPAMEETHWIVIIAIMFPLWIFWSFWKSQN